MTDILTVAPSPERPVAVAVVEAAAAEAVLTGILTAAPSQERPVAEAAEEVALRPG